MLTKYVYIKIVMLAILALNNITIIIFAYHNNLEILYHNISYITIIVVSLILEYVIHFFERNSGIIGHLQV